MSARQSVADKKISDPSQGDTYSRLRRIAQFFGVRKQPIFAEITNRVLLQMEGSSLREEVLPQGYVFVPNQHGDGIDDKTRRYGPRVQWRGTTASRNEGLVSISFVNATGAITRLSLDFESATKLRDSINAHLPALVKTPAVEVPS
ncbi:hypothetical protein OHI65_14805 [Brucella sp. MAB-22]|uniref:hypothetical protein n=1 Tax=Brucella sp. MAB-22 TaxID=2986424 RepID=UPI00221F8A37|nr:hypothetical protein [Brucella sp. MAB-22]UYT57738.1 hypothetical protein OHI65_14805 [Brucella sp. MAB-22]